MKIIKKDNYDRETVSDELVAENVSSFYAERIAELLNHSCNGIASSDFFQAVPDDHELYFFNP